MPAASRNRGYRFQVAGFATCNMRHFDGCPHFATSANARTVFLGVGVGIGIDL
jgi:hypothetical protein